MANTIFEPSAVSGNWNNAADWSAGVPTPGTDAILNASGTYTITISSADTARSVSMDAANATLFRKTAGGSLNH